MVHNKQKCVLSVLIKKLRKSNQDSESIHTHTNLLTLTWQITHGTQIETEWDRERAERLLLLLFISYKSAEQISLPRLFILMSGDCLWWGIRLVLSVRIRCLLCSLAFSKFSWLSSVLSLTFPSSSFCRKRGLPRISPLRLLCAAVESASYPLAARDSRSKLIQVRTKKGTRSQKIFHRGRDMLGPRCDWIFCVWSTWREEGVTAAASDFWLIVYANQRSIRGDADTHKRCQRNIWHMRWQRNPPLLHSPLYVNLSLEKRCQYFWDLRIKVCPLTV